MAHAVAPTATGTGNVVFELERLEHAESGLLELSGRWFGVRGRRFVRPTLTVVALGRPQRLLADLSHKPWPAEDGAEWIAAFPWDGDPADLAEIELNVAPDISIVLTGAGGGAADAAIPAGSDPARVELQRTWADLADERRESERLRRELASARDSLDETQAELEQLRESAVQAGAAISRRDAALAKLETLESESAEAARALERAHKERDQAMRARDHALIERDAAVAERDQAATRAEHATRERERALRERDRAGALRDEALRERDQAAVLREHAAASREQAVRDARAQPPAGPPDRSTPPQSLPPIIQPLSRRHHLTLDVGWATRAVAIAVLVAAIIAFLIVARIF
ncbi:MAG TPA: hypothetical protein VGI87_07670 [Solirubrobacteraceae bacterium]|jgi:hypothetical protein